MQNLNVLIFSRQLDLSRQTPLKNATLKRATHTNDANHPRRQVPITSIPVSQHTYNIQESTPAIEHGPSHTVQTVVKRRAWPFASSPAVYNKGVDTVRKNNKFYTKLRAVYITIDGSHYVWQKAQTAISHYTMYDVLGRECLWSLVPLSPR